MPATLASIKALIIDMDGVLWRGTQPLPGVSDLFNFLTEHSIRYLLATNNAARTVAETRQRIEAMGVDVRPDQILTAAGATVRWLRQNIPPGSPILIVAGAGLYEAMEGSGFQVLDSAGSPAADTRPAAVLVGLDRQLTYDKLRRANSAIRAGARFIATNTDATLPTENGVVPGAGSIVAAVETASATTPTIIGKPYRPLFDAALEMLGTAPPETAMLGDRLDTDIEGGRNAGLATILVLTGVTSPDEAKRSPLKADWTFDNLDALREEWFRGLEKGQVVDTRSR